jgi:DNA-binding CsgD family transcriptional regulator
MARDYTIFDAAANMLVLLCPEMDQGAYDSLSPRERECLRLVAQGLTSKEIAAALSAPGGSTITPLTVDGYIKSGMRKTGTSHRREAARGVVAREGITPHHRGW